MQVITNRPPQALPSELVELTAAELRLVPGGLPKGTWSALLGLPKGGWAESIPRDSSGSGLPKGTW